MKKRTLVGLVLLATAALVAYKSQIAIPKGAVAVKPFFKEKYLGQWFEIARMDFKYERNMTHVTANYSLNKNGTIRVENRGFDTVKKEWKTAVGKAKFVGATDEARLKVSFFGPFYGAYNVIALDDQYKYALVAGQDLRYLWILSREITIPEGVKQKYLELARGIGYDTAALIWVDHKPQP
jgi:apolipoprotein D and lipocalin family protein